MTSVQSPPASASFSNAERQLISLLNASVLDNCTAEPQEENSIALAALNCSATASGPTNRPLVELLNAGTAETWFENEASGVSNDNDCVDGEYDGNYTHDSVVTGQLVCKVESSGLLRMAWLIDGNIGVIAEGSDTGPPHLVCVVRLP